MSGRLVVLKVQEGGALGNPLQLVHRATEALEPAAALADELIGALRGIVA